MALSHCACKQASSSQCVAGPLGGAASGIGELAHVDFARVARASKVLGNAIPMLGKSAINESTERHRSGYTQQNGDRRKRGKVVSKIAKCVSTAESKAFGSHDEQLLHELFVSQIGESFANPWVVQRNVGQLSIAIPAI